MMPGICDIGTRVRRRIVALIAGIICLALASAAGAATTDSVMTSRPSDRQAITVEATGDGRADDTAAIQAAIDRARNGGAGGVVFLPSGRYRITRTLFVWPAVRIFGVGPTRPVLVLADHTAGFQRGVAAMVVFAGGGPDPATPPAFPVQNSVPFNPQIADANPDSFFPAMSNIDMRIGEDNAGAVGVRFHPAQHSFLSHMDFDIGSGLAGVYQVGNQSNDLHFHGGRYGILTEKPSPAWQFVLFDSTFDGQREAAIREHEAGLMLVDVSIRDTPVGIDIDKGYGDWLWGEHLRFDDVSQAGVVVSNESTAFTSIGFRDVVARDTPTFARFRDSDTASAGKGRIYRVKTFNHGVIVPAPGQIGEIATRMDAEPIAALPIDSAPIIRPLPAVSDWVDVHSLGAVGDGRTDDTAALRKAIATHRVLYFPIGRYKVSGTLALRSDTVLIGLHPSLTQIILAENAPAFAGVGAPEALIETPRGGTNIISGLGLFTGGVNPRATALLWRAGAASLVTDVKVEGGHGTQLADGTRFNPYDAMHAADPDPRKRWDGQYPSIWVTDGGGGTFAGIWSPDTYAQAGLYVSHTATPGHVYNLSSEHHVRKEMVLNDVSNWQLFDLQSEEEYGESSEAVSLEIRNSHNIFVANYHGYRVTRTTRPALAAIKLYNSSDIHFRNVHVNAESGYATCDANGCGTFLRANRFPYENALIDVTHGLEVRDRDFAVLDIPEHPAATQPSTFEGWRIEKVADGFHGLSGAAVDDKGRLYFVDHHAQTIYRCSAAKGLEVVRDNALDPVQLAFDRSGNLLVLSSAGSEGTVYSFRPDAPDTSLSVIAATPVAHHPHALIALPINWWVNGEFRDQLDAKTYRYPTMADLFKAAAGVAKEKEFVSPDGSLVLPAFRVFQQGPSDHLGWRWSQPLEAYGLVTAPVGGQIYVSNESEGITYAGTVGSAGTLTDLRPFANRGGESVAVDADGRVYVADGQVFVYAADGRQIGRIDMPERPIGLIFGGPDRRTLYVLSQRAVYRVGR